MTELLEKLFKLVVDQIPNFIAQMMFAVLWFVARPYRTSLFLVRFSRQSKIPAPLFSVLLFALLMIVVGFTHPFENVPNPGAMTRTLAQISAADEHKNDLLFVTLYAVGLASLIALSELFIGLLLPERQQVIFRDTYFVAMALEIPWLVAFGYALIYVVSHVDFFASLVLRGAAEAAVVFSAIVLLSTAPILCFGLQFDRRWFRGKAERQRPLRVASVYMAGVLIFGLAPYYLSWLASALYGDASGLKFSAGCFLRENSLRATVIVENRATSLEFIDGFGLHVSAGPNNYRLDVDRASLLEGLKEDAALGPKEVRRFRLMFVSKDPNVTFSEQAGSADCKAVDISSGHSGYKSLNVDVQFVH
jgi:hypothetical protein